MYLWTFFHGEECPPAILFQPMYPLVNPKIFIFTSCKQILRIRDSQKGNDVHLPYDNYVLKPTTDENIFNQHPSVISALKTSDILFL